MGALEPDPMGLEWLAYGAKMRGSHCLHGSRPRSTAHVYMNSTTHLRAGPQPSRKGSVTLVLFKKICFTLIRSLQFKFRFKDPKDAIFQAWELFSKGCF